MTMGSKLLLVARHEYLRMVRKRSFLIATLALPLFIALISAVSALIASSMDEVGTIGYVDRSGLLGAESDRETIRAFASVEKGQAAVVDGEISILFVVPEDYLQTRQVEMTIWDEAPGEDTWERWDSYVRWRLVSDQPEAIRGRLLEESHIIVQSVDGRSSFDTENFMDLLVPMFAAIMFMVVGLSANGYLLQAMVEEKENRTIEIIISSVSPNQLTGGKTLGLLAVGLTQLAVWLATGAVALPVVSALWGPLPPVRVSWQLVLAGTAYFLPTYALNAALMIAIGGLVDEVQHAQPVAAPLTLFFILPIMLIPLILSNPGSPILVAMTLFPPSAFATIIIRNSVAVVPAWQMILSWALLMGATLGAVRLSARIFRRGMLRYGQRLNLRELFSRASGA